jgi:putative membrane protein
MNYKLGISIGLMTLVALFIVQNTAVVELQFLWWRLGMSRSLMIIFVLAVGVVIGWLLGSHHAHKQRGL